MAISLNDDRPFYRLIVISPKCADLMPAMPSQLATATLLQGQQN
jgi:hypothetical protein